MKCSFCGRDVEEGTGKIFVNLDGSADNFCSTKCERNSRIRSPRHVLWTEIFKSEVKSRRAATAKHAEQKHEKAAAEEKKAKSEAHAKEAKPVKAEKPVKHEKKEEAHSEKAAPKEKKE